MIKRILLLAIAGIAAVVVGLILAPGPIAPAAWQPKPAPALTGVYAPNEALKPAQRLAAGIGNGPEGIAVDAAGQVYAGFIDGRVIRLAADAAAYVELANTGGRPLGLSIDATGNLVIADARKGLLQLTPDGRLETLVDSAGGVAFGFTNDVDRAAADGMLYFTDASSKFRFPDYLRDQAEHRPHGRLLRYDPQTHVTDVLLDGLYFANGVAVGPDDAYVLVNETTAYRVIRYWLKGEKAGQHEIFIDNLPGFPDNLSFNGRDRFWLALASPRDPQVDALAGWPTLRKLIARLPGRVQALLQSHVKNRSFVLGLDLDGKIVANLQYAGDDAYAPITSVEEQGPWLYFGSFSAAEIARLPLQNVVPGAPPPPPGAQDAPLRPEAGRQIK